MVLTIPQAVTNSYVESYEAKVYSGNALVGSFHALSGQIFIPNPQSVKIRLTGLDQTKDYTVKVYAVNSYGVLSKNPLKLNLIIGDL